MHNAYKYGIMVAILSIALFTMGMIGPTVDAKKVKTEKCNNIKILVKVSGVEVNSTYTATVNLGTGQKVKTGTADDNISLTLPVNFHKIQPCPAIGFPFSGDVNGTDFTGTINSLKKPNRVSVNLS